MNNKVVLWSGLLSIFLNSAFISYVSGFLTLEGVRFQLMWNWIAALDHYNYLSLALIPASTLLFFIAPILGIIYGYKLLAGGQIKKYAISYLTAALLLMAGLLSLGQFTFFLYYIVIAIAAFFIFPELRMRSYEISSQINASGGKRIFIIAILAGVILGILCFSALIYNAKQAQTNENLGDQDQKYNKDFEDAKSSIYLNDPNHPTIKEFLCENGWILEVLPGGTVQLRGVTNLDEFIMMSEQRVGGVKNNSEFVLNNYAEDLMENENAITYIGKCKNVQGKNLFDFYPLVQ